MIVAMAAGCAPKATSPKSSQGEDDISQFRPRYTPGKETVKPAEPRETAAARPVNQDDRQLEAKLDSVYAKNQTVRTVPGYKIIAYTGNDRAMAENAVKTITGLYPDSKPELTYVSPNFKVRVGDFYDRVEAQLMYLRLKDYLPQVIVVAEKVKIK